MRWRSWKKKTNGNKAKSDQDLMEKETELTKRINELESRVLILELFLSELKERTARKEPKEPDVQIYCPEVWGKCVCQKPNQN
jgi:hypothetical protein